MVDELETCAFAFLGEMKVVSLLDVDIGRRSFFCAGLNGLDVKCGNTMVGGWLDVNASQQIARQILDVAGVFA